MRKVLFHPLRLIVTDHLLTIGQHYERRHRFECAECDLVFKSEGARDGVFVLRSSLIGNLG